VAEPFNRHVDGTIAQLSRDALSGYLYSLTDISTSKGPSGELLGKVRQRALLQKRSLELRFRIAKGFHSRVNCVLDFRIIKTKLIGH
jgi:hypothetical protein